MEEGQKAGVQSVSAPLQRRRASYTYTDPLDDESEEALWSYLDEKPSDCVVALLWMQKRGMDYTPNTW